MTAKAILFLDHASAMGGAEYSLLSIMKHLDKKQWKVQLAAPPGALLKHVQHAGIKTHEIQLGSLRSGLQLPFHAPKSLWQMIRIIKNSKVRLVYANTPRTAVFGALAARFSGVPCIWHMRDFWLSESKPRYLWIDRIFKKWLLALVDHVITNSNATAAHLPRHSTKISIIHNGIDPLAADMEADKNVFRKQQGIPKTALVVGMAARLRPWKGQKRFINAMHKVAKIKPETYFLIVGGDEFSADNTYEKSLRQQVADLKLESRVIFTGQLSDINPALNSMDIFVHPGDPEPFGRVNLEAMRLAKPVVALNQGALPEIVIHNESGLLVPPDDTSLANAILQLLDAPEQRQAMGLNGQKRVMDYFLAEQMTAKIDRLMRQVCT